MEILYTSPDEYLFNLHTSSSSEAKRLWRQSIREKWNHKCAYCESEQKLTIDHIIPQAKGGSNFLTNVCCCCESCNRSKAHTEWETWFKQQDFFTDSKRNAIVDWMSNNNKQSLYKYRQRRNNVS
jgi:hypothetical protein